MASPNSRVIVGISGTLVGCASTIVATLNHLPWLAIAGSIIALTCSVFAIISLASAARAMTVRMNADAARLRQSLSMPSRDSSELDESDTAANVAVDAAVDAVRAGRESERQLRAIVDGIDDCLLATDSRGIILLANTAAAAEFGRVGQLAGLAIEDVLAQAEVLEMHRSALIGRQRRAQIRLPRAGQNRFWQVSALPVPLLDGPGAVLTLRDVTDLANAVHLKTDFVANASHELRTPLSSIKAAVETLTEGAKDEPPMRDRLLAMIGTNVSRLEELIADLLDLSRLETPDAPIELRHIRTTDLTESLTSMFETVCKERQLSLAFEWHPSIHTVNSDPRLLTLILKNLIENATKFASEGSTVRIAAEPIGDNSPALRGIRLRVIDRGVGIPLAHQARIFERFYQVDPARSGTNARRGTGLGLAIVKHAVKSLGGSIAVESVWQQGTTMIVELPRSLAAK